MNMKLLFLLSGIALLSWGFVPVAIAEPTPTATERIKPSTSSQLPQTLLNSTTKTSQVHQLNTKLLIQKLAASKTYRRNSNIEILNDL